jgi:hypothetical protein
MEGLFLLAFAASKAVWRGTPQAGKSSFRPPFSVCSFAPSGKQDGTRPMWDSGVRKALKSTAAVEGCDFAGLGLHTLRRANITWRQEVGGSSIEASQIAGHASSKMTGEYTVVQLRRQEELTRRLQEKLAQVGKRRVKTQNITRR